MIVFISPIFDVRGNITLHESGESELLKITPRVSQRKALNGRTVLAHYGVTIEDSKLKIVVNDATNETYQRLKLWILKYSFLYVSFVEGVFKCAITDLSFTNKLVIELALKEIKR